MSNISPALAPNDMNDAGPIRPAASPLLRDGAHAVIRPLTIGDYGSIMELTEALPEHDIYLRFFNAHPAHLDTWACSLTAQTEQQYAVGAFEEGALLGVANYYRTDAPGTAEVSVLVAKEHRGRGVGTALLQHLADQARTNGIHHLLAEILRENAAMAAVMAGCRLSCSQTVDGSVMDVDVGVDAPTDPGGVRNR